MAVGILLPQAVACLQGDKRPDRSTFLRRSHGSRIHSGTHLADNAFTDICWADDAVAFTDLLPNPGWSLGKWPPTAFWEIYWKRVGLVAAAIYLSRPLASSRPTRMIEHSGRGLLPGRAAEVPPRPRAPGRPAPWTPQPRMAHGNHIFTAPACALSGGPGRSNSLSARVRYPRSRGMVARPGGSIQV